LRLRPAARCREVQPRVVDRDPGCGAAGDGIRREAPGGAGRDTVIAAEEFADVL